MNYTIKTNDTLADIANYACIPITTLKAINHLTTDDVRTGQVLFIPILPCDIIRPGSSKTGVTQIQEVLISIGFPIGIDGFYGNEMEEIILNLQKKSPEIEADGIYNLKTRLLLLNLLISGYHIIKDPSNILALINKKNALHHAYKPDDLVIPGIPFKEKGFDPQKQMRKEAALSLERMIAAAVEIKLYLAGVSGYRSYEMQANTYKEVWQRSPDTELAFYARPGESEHQSGLAMDVSSPNANYECEQWFEDTAEGKWLAENARYFGFIIRYPKGRESITGYPYEPWHLRYVGEKAAYHISHLGLTLDEYLSPPDVIRYD